MSGSLSVVAFEGELNSIVKEYLEAGSYEQTANAFSKECDKNGKQIINSSKPLRSNTALLSIQNEMIQYFQYGNGKEFFNMWEDNLPENVRSGDSVAQKLEFYLHIYFAIYPIKHGSTDTQGSVDAGMAQFKTYLETRGSSLSQTTEFLPFYALPFVPNPRAHPSYKELFSDSWVPDLQDRLERFLTLAMHSQPQPRLFDLYRNVSSGPSKDVLEQMQKMQQQVIDADRKCTTYVRRYTRIQADYHNLIGVSADLVEMLEQIVQGKQMSPDHMNRILTKLFTKHMRDSRQSMDITRPGTAAQALRASIAQKPLSKPEEALLSSLDYEKIKHDLLTSSDRSKAFLLQALRWRLTRSVPGEQRDTVLSAYIEHDILGCAGTGDHRQVILDLLGSKDEVVRQYSARLFNAFASLCEGRIYLSLNKDLLGGLMSTLMAEDKDSMTRENVLGALQKLSLRRTMQTAMIEEGVIQWLVTVLEDNDNLSDYTLEYSVALLMNLCLRMAGKKDCSKDPHRVLEVLSNLLGHENEEIFPYVNGALYSILGIPAIREEAKAMDMEAILKCFIKDDTPDMNRQLEFIIKQLNSKEKIDETESDDEEEDDEDEEDQDAMEADLDKAEVLKPRPGELFGERLLGMEYLGLLTNAVNGRKKNKHLDAVRGEPMQRPITPGQFKGSPTTSMSEQSMPSSPPPKSPGRHSQSRPGSKVSRPVTGDRPPTRSGSRGNSRPGTAEDPSPQFVVDNEGSNMISKAIGVDRKLAAPDSATSVASRPSQRASSNTSSAGIAEHSAAFSTRSRITRTPDTASAGSTRSTNRPTSQASRGGTTPQPKYSASLPRPSTQERGHGGRLSGKTSKPTSGSSTGSGRVQKPT